MPDTRAAGSVPVMPITSARKIDAKPRDVNTIRTESGDIILPRLNSLFAKWKTMRFHLRLGILVGGVNRDCTKPSIRGPVLGEPIVKQLPVHSTSPNALYDTPSNAHCLRGELL